jgi:flagellar motility protein MotE (MotC chaperone)
LASAVAQDVANPEEPTVSKNPLDAQECDTVMSVLLQKKKEALDRRERSVKAREADMVAAEERIKLELERVEQVRNQMREAMQGLDAKQLEEVKRLVKMFEKMRGKKAAAILEQTERDVAVEVLRRMRDKQAGETLSQMKPDTAAELAEIISQFPFETSQE